MLSIDRNQYNVYTFLELAAALNLDSFVLPILGKPRHEHHVVRIPHRNRYPAHLASPELQRQFGSYGRRAHVDLELVLAYAPSDQRAGLQASSGLDRNPFLTLLGANIRRHTSGAVARNLRQGAVGVNQPNLQIRRG